MVDLLKHNQEAFQEINKMIESGTKRIAAPRATGSGKTYLMGALADKYNDDKKLVLEPTRPLLNSIKEKFDEFGIVNIDFISYQKLIRMSDEDIATMDYKLIFLDECHHGTAPVWGQKINYLMKTHSDSIIFGTSATTVRNDGINVIETIFEGNAIGELPLSTAIARKVLPCPHYITAIYRLDDEFEKLKKRIENSTNTKSEKKEFYKKMKAMKLHFEKSYGIPLILNKYIKVKNGRYLVFCKDKKHLDAMRDVVIDWFKTSGIKDIHSYAVYSDYPDKEKDYKNFQEDNSNALKLLFSINMLNEGIHVKDISGVLMLRTTSSNLIYLQQLGRLVDADNMDKYLLVFDFVNNFSSVNDGIGLLKEIKDTVAKEKESDPDFDDSGFENIDTFFVLDQIVEIQKMFREIEERLKGREWTEEENAILREWYQIEGTKVVERLKGRTKVAVKKQAEKLGLSINICKSWSEDEIEILKEYYPTEGLNVIDRLSGRTKCAIKTHANKLGLKIRNGWTEEENNILRKYYLVEGTKVIDRLSGRTKRAIMTQANQLGIKKFKNCSIWTKEEIEILKKYYPVEGTKVIDKLEGRTKDTITAMASKLGIKLNNYWTDEETKILRKWYPKYGSDICDFLPNKTKEMIRNKAQNLKICIEERGIYTKEEDEIIRKYYPIEGSEVYKRLNHKTKKQCRGRAQILGIIKEIRYKYMYKKGNKYVVQFSVDGKNRYFGAYDSEEEAAKVAMEKAKEYGKVI